MIYVYRDASMCPYKWAEVENGLPVHCGDMYERIKALEFPWATQSDVVLSIVGWMIRTGELKLPLPVIFVSKDGIERIDRFASDGTLNGIWSGEGKECIFYSGMNYRNES